MSLAKALEHELEMVKRATLEQRARRVRRALRLIGEAEEWLLRERIKIMRRLHDEFGWTDEATAAYFGLGSRQAVHKIRHKEDDE